MHIEFVRQFCLALGPIEEDIKWDNDLCFTIANKIFCMTALEGDFKVSVKVKDDQFEELCSRSQIIPAPYMARNKWVTILSGDALSREDWEFYIRQSFEIILNKLPKKTRLSLGFSQ